MYYIVCTCPECKHRVIDLPKDIIDSPLNWKIYVYCATCMKFVAVDDLTIKQVVPKESEPT